MAAIYVTEYKFHDDVSLLLYFCSENLCIKNESNKKYYTKLQDLKLLIAEKQKGLLVWMQ